MATDDADSTLVARIFKIFYFYTTEYVVRIKTSDSSNFTERTWKRRLMWTPWRETDATRPTFFRPFCEKLCLRHCFGLEEKTSEEQTVALFKSRTIFSHSGRRRFNALFCGERMYSRNLVGRFPSLQVYTYDPICLER